MISQYEYEHLLSDIFLPLPNHDLFPSSNLNLVRLVFFRALLKLNWLMLVGIYRFELWQARIYGFQKENDD